MKKRFLRRRSTKLESIHRAKNGLPQLGRPFLFTCRSNIVEILRYNLLLIIVFFTVYSNNRKTPEKP